MTYNKLLGKIVEVYGTREAFVKDTGLSRQSLRDKLNGKADWRQKEIIKMCDLLGIPYEEIPVYFFGV